jgi:fatty acid CoA ligase FadD9
VGYVTSKWASEILLGRAHVENGQPVAIVRAGNIAPHRAHPTHLNWADNTNRLLYSLLATREAPHTFYAGEPAGYDLVPADVVAEAVAAIAIAAEPGLTHYHASAANVSLDTIAGWIDTAGVTLARSPHATWFSRFSDALAQLPSERRTRSALPAIERWRAPIDGAHIPRIETTSFQRLLGGKLCGVDEPLVHRWIQVLVDSLDRPA